MKSPFIKLSKLSLLKKLGIGVLLLFCIYLPFEIQNMYVDYYNFRQLEKAKPILESIPANAKKFAGLTNFNILYKADIKPIDNCYHISNSNGNQKYISYFILIVFMYILNMIYHIIVFA